jgi:transposase-like protein
MRLIVEIDLNPVEGHTMTERKLKAVRPRLEALVAQDRDLLKALVKEALDQILQAEMTDFLGAGPNERSVARAGYRAGYYERGLITRVGKIELRVPRDRSGEFSTALFERFQRSEKALVSSLVEMYVQGVSSAATCTSCAMPWTTYRARPTTIACRSYVGSTRAATWPKRSHDLAAWLTRWQRKYPKLTDWVEENIGSTLTFYRLPRQHHKHLKSTNMLERLNEELRRRTRVVRIFPNVASCLRLIRALCVETHEGWLEDKCYLNMDVLREARKEQLRKAA